MPGPSARPAERVSPAVLRYSRTPARRRPVASATSAWPPSCTIVTTVRATGQTRAETTTATASAPLASTSHRGGSGWAVNAWCHRPSARRPRPPRTPDRRWARPAAWRAAVCVRTASAAIPRHPLAVLTARPPGPAPPLPSLALRLALPSQRRPASRDNEPMPAADEQAALRDQCTSFLTGHGPVSVADVIAGIPADTVPDRYGDGGVVAELEAEIAGLLGKPAALFVPSGTMAQQAVLRVHADRRQRRTVVFHPMCHLHRQEGQAYQRLHALTGRPAGDPDRLMTVEDLTAIAEPPAAASSRTGTSCWPRPSGPARAEPPCTSTAPGCGSPRRGTAGRRPRSRRFSTPCTCRSTRASGRCRAAASPGPPTSSPRCGNGGSAWAAPCSACGRAPRRRWAACGAGCR